MDDLAVEPVVNEQVPAKRCPDFDADCADVRDPVACAFGRTAVVGFVIVHCPPADGYCPLLCKGKAP